VLPSTDVKIENSRLVANLWGNQMCQLGRLIERRGEICLWTKNVDWDSLLVPALWGQRPHRKARERGGLNRKISCRDFRSLAPLGSDHKQKSLFGQSQLGNDRETWSDCLAGQLLSSQKARKGGELDRKTNCRDHRPRLLWGLTPLGMLAAW
jgi:hypothetical protein